MRRISTGVFLVSAAAIGYELLLMRVLSIIQWHHFAYMIISLALLGYGASGPFIALFRRTLEPRFAQAFAACAFAFSVAMVEQGRFAGDAMVTHVVDFDGFGDAFEALERPTGQCKVLLEPEGPELVSLVSQ